VKFTSEGGYVKVSTRLRNREVEVTVKDNGPGIPKENLITIFEKYKQFNPESSNRTKGTGLGLSIVKHIITAHGGRVWAESKLGQGRSFIFVLPS
jgi:signal transduction histidine kinase